MKISSLFGFFGITMLFLAPLALFHTDVSILFPYIVGKNFAWRFFVEIAFVLWAAAALLNTQYRFSYKNPLFICLSLFMLVVFLANTLGHDPYTSFWSTAERMDGYIGLIHLYLFFVAFVGLIKNKVTLHIYLAYLVLLGLLLSFVGLGQTKDRVDSVLGNPIYLSSLTLFGTFLSLYFISIKEKVLGLDQRSRLLTFGSAIIVFLLTMYHTGTRGAILGLIAGLFVMAIVFITNSKKTSNRLAVVLSWVMIVLLLGSSLLFWSSREYLANQTFVQESTLLSRATRISLEDRTTSFRLTNWGMALQGAAEKPLLGWGQEGYIKVFTKYYQVEKLHDTEPWYDRVHNVFLDWLVFSGVIGLLAYMSIFAAAVWLVFRNSRIEFATRVVLFGLIVSYLVQNVVAFDSLVSGIFIFTILSGIVVLLKDKKQDRKDVLSPIRFVLIICMFGGVVWWINYSIVTPLQANQNFIKFIAEKRNLPIDERANEQLDKFYIPALEANSFFNQEIIEHMIRLKEKFLTEEISPETIARYKEVVDQYTKPILARDPENTKLWIMYADFLQYIGAYEEAEAAIRTAAEQAPTKPTVLWTLGKILYKQGKEEEALAIFKSVYEEIPESALAKKIYDQAVLELQ